MRTSSCVNRSETVSLSLSLSGRRESINSSEVSENKSQVEKLRNCFPSGRQYFSVGPGITACGKNALKSLELRGYTFLSTGVRPDKCFSFVCATGETMFFFCFVFFLPKLPSVAFISSDSTLLWAPTKRHKDTHKKKCHNQRILMFRLYTRGADSWAERCDYTETHFHISLLPPLPVSLPLSSRLSLRLCFITLLFLSPSGFFLPLSPLGALSFFPLHTRTDRPLFRCNPVILAFAVGVLSDPLVQYPGVEWGTGRNGSAVMRVSVHSCEVCVCVGSSECDECVV